MALIEFTDKGMYVPAAGVYIDPWKPVDRALITHGHSDHARWGCKHYLAHEQSLPILRRRLGDHSFQGIAYGLPIWINGVEFTFFPAGHVLGSSQIRVKYRGETWVASGDYKVQDDGVSAPFEPVHCHTFITESTFGLPVYNWQSQNIIMNEIHNWWAQNQADGKCSILFAYSLGKAQRILQALKSHIGNVFVHGAVAYMNEAYIEAGISLNPYTKVSADIDNKKYRGALIITPSSADNTPWMRKFEPYSTAVASGWMALRGFRRRLSADRGFVLSDHADWQGLNHAIEATGAQKVIVTHGYTQTFAKWLTEKGLEGIAVETQYAGEVIETTEDTQA